jgi:hypothetical protein
MFRNIPRHEFSKYFWIDTFCIPVKQNQDHLRRLAVDRIALTYAAATHVLVLDKAVEHTRFEELLFMPKLRRGFRLPLDASVLDVSGGKSC